MRKLTILTFLLASTIFAIKGCASPKPIRGDSNEMSHPLHKIKPEKREKIKFDYDTPYKLEFGRGSGWHGLNTIAIDEKGEITLHRQQKKKHTNYYWETATLTGNKEIIKQIAQHIQDLHLVEMERAYYADIHDGTQWIFWLIQNGQEKSIYFDNHFPGAIQDFAIAIDNILKSAGLESAKWTPVPIDKKLQHQKPIWNSIKDKKAK